MLTPAELFLQWTGLFSIFVALPLWFYNRLEARPVFHTLPKEGKRK